MPLPHVRPMADGPSDPLLHDLPPIRFDGQVVAVRLAVRRDTEDGIWRARLHFAFEGEDSERITAEIFCATTEQDLWLAVRDLRDHHLRDLFRSLTS
ncbi:MAG: hypothetical protein ACHQU1_07020 [Gemmatimonadales bacterium]